MIVCGASSSVHRRPARPVATATNQHVKPWECRRNKAPRGGGSGQVRESSSPDWWKI